MSDELPKGWAEITLQDAGAWRSGGTPSRRKPEYFGKGIPWVKSGDLPDGPILKTDEEITKLGLENSAAKLMPVGTISMALYGATIGKLGMMTFPAATNQACANIVPDTRLVEPQFLFNYLFSERRNFIEQGQGGAQPNISQEIVRSHPFPLAPLAEQRRIVAKLEKLLGQVDACQQRLEKLPTLLKRFRQSILAAACSGRLTADWRRSNVIEGEADGNLPVGWRLAELKDISDTIDPNPSHRYPSYENGSVPILATEQMRGLNDWDVSNAKLVNPAFYEERRAAHGFRSTDIIFARKGRLGLARRAPNITRFVFSHTIFIIRTKDAAPSDYLLWFLRQDECVKWLLAEMNSNTGVPTLGKGYMERLPVAWPPLAEQQEIVRRVADLFALADHESAFSSLRTGRLFLSLRLPLH